MEKTHGFKELQVLYPFIGPITDQINPFVFFHENVKGKGGEGRAFSREAEGRRCEEMESCLSLYICFNRPLWLHWYLSAIHISYVETQDLCLRMPGIFQKM